MTSCLNSNFSCLLIWSRVLKCDGGGFFLACKDLGRMFDHSCSAFALFFVFFFLKVEISSCPLISLFMPRSIHSGSVG